MCDRGELRQTPFILPQTFSHATALHTAGPLSTAVWMGPIRPDSITLTYKQITDNWDHMSRVCTNLGEKKTKPPSMIKKTSKLNSQKALNSCDFSIFFPTCDVLIILNTCYLLCKSKHGLILLFKMDAFQCLNSFLNPEYRVSVIATFVFY